MEVFVGGVILVSVEQERSILFFAKSLLMNKSVLLGHGNGIFILDNCLGVILQVIVLFGLKE